MTNSPKYNLSLQEAIVALRQQSLKNRAQTEDGLLTEQLRGMSVDEAYDVGYATLLHDLETLTGPDPFEVHAVVPTEVGLVDLGPAEDTTLTTEETN